MSETQQHICEFVAGIQAYVSPVNVINPWRDYVMGYDIGPRSGEDSLGTFGQVFGTKNVQGSVHFYC
ncbi:hypothetical protein MKX68_10065 [Paenibacillus sp. FSL M8-0212]|uniref:hypothetical protein n=1 Tax=Paenibacillus sp. FSL M8-0212 TaxID=2921618 RepID=UPI0030F7F62C